MKTKLLNGSRIEGRGHGKFEEKEVGESGARTHAAREQNLPQHEESKWRKARCTRGKTAKHESKQRSIRLECARLLASKYPLRSVITAKEIFLMQFSP